MSTLRGALQGMLRGFVTTIDTPAKLGVSMLLVPSAHRAERLTADTYCAASVGNDGLLPFRHFFA